MAVGDFSGLLRQLAMLQQSNRRAPVVAATQLGQGISQGAGAIADQLRLLSQNQRQDELIKQNQQFTLDRDKARDDFTLGRDAAGRKERNEERFRAELGQAAQQRQGLFQRMNELQGQENVRQEGITRREGEIKRREGEIKRREEFEADQGRLTREGRLAEIRARNEGRTGTGRGPDRNRINSLRKAIAQEDGKFEPNQSLIGELRRQLEEEQGVGQEPALDPVKSPTATFTDKTSAQALGAPAAGTVAGPVERGAPAPSVEITSGTPTGQAAAPVGPVSRVVTAARPKAPTATRTAFLLKRLQNRQVVEPQVSPDGTIVNPAKDPAARFFQEIAKIVMLNKAVGNRLSADDLVREALASARNVGEMSRIVGGRPTLIPLKGVFVTPRGVEVDGVPMSLVQFTSLQERLGDIVHPFQSGIPLGLGADPGDVINGKRVVGVGTAPVPRAVPAFAKVMPFQKRPEFSDEFIERAARAIWEAHNQ